MAADVIVTVRMPSSLVGALRQRTATDHYHDLSEQVRSITRKACLAYLERLGPSQPQDDLVRALSEIIRRGGRG